jgi:hypothetical protein
LGFKYSDKEWLQIRQMLSRTNSSNSQNNSNSDNSDSGMDEERFMVKNGDFFSALHLIMSNKQNRHRGLDHDHLLHKV